MAWAELSDCRCYYELHGDGEPLLLIPGLAATSQIWDPVVPDFAQFFSVIQFDNRGVGRSIAKRPPKTMPDLVSDIVELLDRLQLDRVHVLGVSLGGIIAQRLAIDHPSRVGRLVLVSCCDTFSPYLRQISQFLAHTLRRFPKKMFVRTLELLATSPEFLDAHGDVVEQRVLRKCNNRVSARAVGNQMRCLQTAEMAPDHYRIHSPTLVIAGEHDPIIPSCYSKRMADKIPGSVFSLIGGAGHNPIVDHAHEAVPLAIEFLRADEDSGGQLETIESFVPYFGGLSAGVVHGGDVS